jgi:hypothetical protein
MLAADATLVGALIGAFATLAAASGAALFQLRSLRRTHVFDALLRTAAVYHDILPPKRRVAATFLIDHFENSKDPTECDLNCIHDLVTFFDMLSYKIVDLVGSRQLKKAARSLDLGRQSTRIRRGDLALVILHELAAPAAYYYYAFNSRCLRTHDVMNLALTGKRGGDALETYQWFRLYASIGWVTPDGASSRAFLKREMQLVNLNPMESRGGSFA